MLKQYNHLKQVDKSNHIRKLTISIHNAEPVLDLHCHPYDFNTIEIMQLIQELHRTRKLINIGTYSADHCYFILNELTLIDLVDFLSKYDFDIDETILNHYHTIKSWNQIDIKSKYQPDTNSTDRFSQLIKQEISNAEITQNIIKDRSIRYQYFVDKSEYNGNNLTERIANRSQSKIWIDNKKFSIVDIVESIIELHRAPVLFVFNQYFPEQSLDYLKSIELAAKQYKLTKLGVYFRLSNNQQNYQQFNEYVANNCYNKLLIEDTQIAIIQDGKLPKFMFKTAWNPKTIILLNTGLKQNKTMTYAQDTCDLIIEYSDTSPIQLEKTAKKQLWK